MILSIGGSLNISLGNNVFRVTFRKSRAVARDHRAVWFPLVFRVIP